MQEFLIAQKTGLTKEEVHLLAHAPAVILQMVGKADGCIDTKEFKTYNKWCKLKAKQDKSLWKLLKEVSFDGWEQVREIAFNQTEEYLGRLSEVISSLDTNKYDHQQVKNDLIELAQQVAGASGGFLGFGNKVDEDEAMMIEIIENALNTSFDEVD